MPPATPPPPPGVRRPTSEFDAAIASLATNLRQVSEELATERQARKDDKDKGLSVTKLHVPFVMVFAFVGMLVGVATTAGLFVHETRAHISDSAVHVNATAAAEGKGVAYKRDIADAVSGVEQHSRASLRAIVKNSPFVCTPLHPGDSGYGRGKTECKIQEPEIRQ